VTSQCVDGFVVDTVDVGVEVSELTPSGKVDRQALPPPEPQNGQPTGPAGPQSASGEPQTRTERLLAGIWRSVLDLPHVDADDNFFERQSHDQHVTSQREVAPGLRCLGVVTVPPYISPRVPGEEPVQGFQLRCQCVHSWRCRWRR
jgi:hypothetical protein